MGEIGKHFQRICELLGERAQNIVTEPLFWAMVFLLVCCMVLTYSGASQSRLSNSIVNTVRQLGVFFIDTFNSIVQACRSLFGFLDVLRVLFFGHLGQSTLYVLNNYAIIFLSMASFLTTMQGMFSLIGWTGILVSFGVQAMELVSTMGLVLCWVPPKVRYKEAVTYTYCPPDIPPKCKHGGSSTLSDDDAKKLDSLLNEPQPKYRWTFWWGRFRRTALPFVLLFAYIASAFFSYCYIFDAIVMPEIAYDDYMESIDLVMENTEAFERQLTAYRTELARGLGRLNSEVSRSFADGNFPTLEARLQAAQDSYEATERAVSSAWEVVAQTEANTPAYDTAYGIYLNALTRRDAVREQLRDLEQEQSSSHYAIFQAIQRLSNYYADPLYLSRNVENGDLMDAVETAVNSVNRDFTAVLERAFDLRDPLVTIASEDTLRIAFSNLTSLSRYYAEHSVSGLDLSGEDGVEALLERRAEILEEYNNRKNTPSDTDKENADAQNDDTQSTDDEDAKRLEAANSYLNGETGKLLIAAMRALESTPQFSTVGLLWPGENESVAITPQEPGVSVYLNQFNQKYRASNGQLTLQERAITKLLWSPNRTTSLFSLILAFALDGMIIILCFVRERRHYTNNSRSLRQMAAMLFVIPATEEEQRSNEQGRRMILAGTVMGCLIYLIYFKLFPNTGESSAIVAFVLIVFGIMLMALLRALQNTLQEKKSDSDPTSVQPGQEKDSAQPQKNVDCDDPIKIRLTPSAFDLFSSKLKCARFQKCCTIRKPKVLEEQQGAVHYQREKKLWRQNEDHKIRPHILSHEDYETIITSCGKSTEYYVLADDVKDCCLTLQFAILLSQNLIYGVQVPKPLANNDSADGISDDDELVNSHPTDNPDSVKPSDIETAPADTASGEARAGDAKSTANNNPTDGISDGSKLINSHLTDDSDSVKPSDTKDTPTDIDTVGGEAKAEDAVALAKLCTERAYILTKDFIRLLYECILLRTVNGNSWEYSMEDDMLDYEREDDDDEK